MPGSNPFSTMSRTIIAIAAVFLLVVFGGCSRNSGEKIRYDMEKLYFAAGKSAERINIQPDLATTADSAALKAAYQEILRFYFDHRNDPKVSGNDSVRTAMERMAVTTEAQLARFYAAQRQADSVIAAYRKIGRDIPAGREDLGGATLALALTYRALNDLDSTLTIYDRLLAGYFPPWDSLERVNTDVIAVPIDKIKIGQALKDSAMTARFVREALEYYGRLKSTYPGSITARTASIYIGRTHAMVQQWDQAIAELQNVTDSTGQLAVQAEVLIAGIYEGPKNDPRRAIDLYRRILDRKPDSATVGRAMLRLGRALCEVKEYEDGRQVLADAKKKFERYPNLVAPAQLQYAQAFEQQGRWDRAVSEYQWLMENYPYSEEAFRVALHVPEHFASIKDQKMADIWFNRAIEFYQSAAQNRQGQPISIAAYSFLADTYRRLGRWREALDALDKIYALAPKSPLAARALYNSARVAYQELKDSTLAQSYLDRLNSTFGTTDSASIHQRENPEFNLESIE
jgi:tetratricopeptide (TPR) repeat protein